MAKQVSTQWAMDARCANMAEGARQEDIGQPVDGMKPGLEADVAPPPTKSNAAQSEDKHPLPSPVEPAVDATGEP